MAARCQLADGRRVFVKAVSPDQNPDSPAMARAEVATAVVLAGAGVRVPAPALRWVLDDGWWVVLVFEDLDGALPRCPWRDDELRLVLRAMAEVAGEAAPAALPTVGERLGGMFDGWHRVAAGTGEWTAAGVDQWAQGRLDDLMAWEAAWPSAADGAALVHGDIRSDNTIVCGERVFFVDWTSVGRGASWFDLVVMVPSLVLEGAGSPSAVLSAARRWGGEALVPPEGALVPVVAALSGYFVSRGMLPDPPGLPTVRAFQRAQGAVTVAWLRQLAG
jgi:aminoglycoside phosphotransferase (APT) family kinase protein